MATNFLNVFNKYKNVEKWYSKGEIDILEEHKKMYFGNRVIDITKISEEDIKYLREVSSKAHFGKGRKRVLDEDVRKSKDIKSIDMGLQFNPHEYSNIVESVIRIVDYENIVFKYYKLNMYEENDFFDYHQDTPEKDLIATLVINLPTKFQGGNLEFKHELIGNYTHNFSVDKMSYIAFLPHIHHRVSKVTNGCRLTLTFKVFSKTYNKDDDDYDDFMYKELEDSLIEVLRTTKESYIGYDLLYANNREEFRGLDKYIISILRKNKIEYEILPYFHSTAIKDLESYVEDKGGGSDHLHHEDIYRNVNEEDKIPVSLIINRDENWSESIYKLSYYYTRQYGYTGNSPINSTCSLHFNSILLIKKPD